jgi:hypothetical protein
LVLDDDAHMHSLTPPFAIATSSVDYEWVVMHALIDRVIGLMLTPIVQD